MKTTKIVSEDFPHTEAAIQKLYASGHLTTVELLRWISINEKVKLQQDVRRRLNESVEK